MRISHSGSKLKTDYEFFQLFADFSLSYPLIPSIYKDIYHLAQRIINPLVLVLWLVENLRKILSNKKLTFGSYFFFSQSDMVSCPKPKLHG